MLFLGLDSGTLSCKALVLDADSGKVLAQARIPHTFVENLPHGHLEQEPRTWIDAADSAIAQCLEQIRTRRKEIAAIGVSGQQHGLVTLDERHQPVRPSKLWCDISTAEQARELNRAFGNVDEIIRRTGNAIVAGYTAPKILWLKEHEPDNFRHTRTILLPHDYLNAWLTGERQMEFGDASGTGLLDIRTRKWCEPLMKFIDDELLEKFPPLRSSTRALGLLRATLGEKWGIGDALVSAGGGDNMMGAIGTGNIQAGRLTLSLGTSGTLYAFSETPIVDERGEISAFCDSTDHWLPLVCTMNVANAVARVRKLFAWDMATLEMHAAQSPPGANGLTFLPYFQGERLPDLPNGSAVIHGLNFANTNRADISRALIEGIVIGLANGLKRLLALGVEAGEVTITGGGGLSPTARQIVSDVFGMPVNGLKIAEGAALGAAMQAAWTFSQTKGKPIALEKFVQAAVKVDRKMRAEPRKENAALYAELRGRHADLTRKLASSGYL
ncbi:MAG: xylulokinase [Verrucomicrobiota bacterium]|nr:xylulokinase [Verrucomicrobiota bacterium]